MSAIVALIRVQLISGFRAVQLDWRTRVSAGVIVALDLVAAFWSTAHLMNEANRWPAPGSTVLDARLWQLYGMIWLGMAVGAALATIKLGFADDHNDLLLTLPISSGARMRALYVLLWLDGLWNWLVLAVVVSGVTLARPLGVGALRWIVLLIVGAGAAVWVGLTGTVIIRLLSGRSRRGFVGICCVLAFAVVAVLVYKVGQGDVSLALPLQHAIWVPQGKPEFVALLLTLVLAAALLPLAGPVGSLYANASRVTRWQRERHDGPGETAALALTKLLVNRRGLVGALLLKGLVTRIRHWVNWARLVMVLLWVVSFPWVRSLLSSYAIQDEVLVVEFVTALALLLILDAGVSPIGGEGNRLALYLTAPLNRTDFLQAKMIVLLLLLLVPGILLGLALGWQVGLGLGDTLLATISIALNLIAVVALFAWGSACDADLGLSFEGGLQSIIYEEAPITQRRMGMALIGLLLVTAELALLARTPPSLALPCLALLDAVMLGATWRVAQGALRQVVRR